MSLVCRWISLCPGIILSTSESAGNIISISAMRTAQANENGMSAPEIHCGSLSLGIGLTRRVHPAKVSKQPPLWYILACQGLLGAAHALWNIGKRRSISLAAVT